MLEAVHIIPQRQANDCGISCLAMLLGVSYEEASRAIREINPKSMAKNGLYIKELEQAGRLLGGSFKRRRKIDLESDTGILRLAHADHPHRMGHFVILQDGRIIDPADGGMVWDTLTYLEAHKFVPKTLLTLKKEAR